MVQIGFQRMILMGQVGFTRSVRYTILLHEIPLMTMFIIVDSLYTCVANIYNTKQGNLGISSCTFVGEKMLLHRRNT